MGSLLVHVTHGPEAPTRAALALTVANAAVNAGHEVSVFMAGDAAYLVKDAVIDNLHGIGTGSLNETLPALIEAGVEIYVSGGSSKSRGVTASDIEDKGIAFAGPPQLVELAFEVDRVLCY